MQYASRHARAIKKVLLINIVVKLVIWGEGQQDTEPRSQWEKDLSGGVHPHLGLGDCVEIGLQVVFDAHGGAGQRHAPDQKCKKHHIGEKRGEPHNFARSGDTLPQGKVADQVDDQQAGCHVPLDGAHVVDAWALVQLQNVPTAIKHAFKLIKRSFE